MDHWLRDIDDPSVEQACLVVDCNMRALRAIGGVSRACGGEKWVL